MTDQRAPDPLIGQDAVAPRADEPADSLAPTWAGQVAGDNDAAAPAAVGRGRSGVRWLLALVGVVIVAAGTALIVSLAGARPTASTAIGWMPDTTTSYSEVRLDLPGDQRQKLAAFLAHFPGFKDQSQIEPKLTDVLDRIVRAASKDTQTWATDIQPWFGGQLALGMGTVADPVPTASAVELGSVEGTLAVATVTDRAKAIDWILKTTASLPTPLSRTTYGTADLFTTSAGGEVNGAIAVTDKALLVGLDRTVKAAVDSNGSGTLGANAEIKAALATADQDYVAIAVTRTRAQIEGMIREMGSIGLGSLDGTQVDETIVAMVPPWASSAARFENDAIVIKNSGPSWSIGVDVANRASQLLGHVPAKTIAYFEAHDAGPTLKALVEKFRSLPETKPAFDQVDQALSLLGGFDAVVTWWGDTAFVVSPVADGTIGGGLVIKPRDAAAGQRLLSVLDGFLAIGGSSQGLTTRSEDHNGTKITILDLSGAPGMTPADLPPGYKAEIAWATNADVTVVGYGPAFVTAVLDAGPGNSLGDDARFKALLGRVGADNISAGYVDVAGIMALVEPLAQPMAPADEWTRYTTEIKPYLEHLDALIQAVRKDQGLDIGNGAFTVR
jgi:Protein of unknown function (DUF3352)